VFLERALPLLRQCRHGRGVTTELRASKVLTFEETEIDAVRQVARDAIQRAIVTLAYFTGWRVASEILKLEWKRGTCSTATTSRAKRIWRTRHGSCKR
jgi:hypothetical protein